MIDINDYIDTSEFFLKEVFECKPTPWSILKMLEPSVRSLIEQYSRVRMDFQVEAGAHVALKSVNIGSGTIIESGAYIKGPAVIGRNVKIRHGAYIRENVIVGDNSIIGHASEIKHSIIMNNTNIPHFNYVGNSIIGNNVNLGARSVCSNYKNLPFGGEIFVKMGAERIGTQSDHFGSLIGDDSKIGCNVVLNPGTLIGKGVITYPSLTLRGCYKDHILIKDGGICITLDNSVSLSMDISPA